MTTEELLKMISSYISEEYLMCPISIESKKIFEGDEVPKNSYVDNGRADIVTERFDPPIVFENKNIFGYTIIDKYLYGRENGTWKKYTVTLYSE